MPAIGMESARSCSGFGSTPAAPVSEYRAGSVVSRASSLHFPLDFSHAEDVVHSLELGLCSQQANIVYCSPFPPAMAGFTAENHALPPLLNYCGMRIPKRKEACRQQLEFLYGSPPLRLVKRKFCTPRNLRFFNVALTLFDLENYTRSSAIC